MLTNLLYVFVITLSLGQFSQLYKSGDSAIYLFDVVAIIFAAYGLLYFLQFKKSVKVPKVFIPFLFFVGVGVVSLGLSAHNLTSDQVLVALFYAVRFVAYLLDALVVFNMLEAKIITRASLFNLLIYSCVFVAIAGFVQLVVLPDFTTLDPSLGWDPHKNRLASTFFDPNFVGAYLSLGLAVLLDKFFSKKWSHADSLFFVILLVALLLTFSRSAWLMFASIVLVFGIFKSRTLLLVSALVLFSAYFAVPRIQTRIAGVTDPADSAQFRLVSWSNAWQITKDNLVFGVGFNAYRYAQESYGFLTVDTVDTHSGSGTDSSLLLVLATTGIIGFAFYGVGLIDMCLKFKAKPFILGLAIFAGLVVESTFINSLFYPQIMLWFFVLLGCALQVAI
jgi:O-antigen ligase